MRTVTLIQFTERREEDYGYEPEIGRYYELVDLDDTYYLEDDEDEEEAYDSIRIRYVMFAGDNRKYYQSRHILKNSGTNYNLLTIELDETSQLFKL